MIKELMVRTQGEVQLDNGREFTRLVGGFGEDKPIISDLQIAELLGYSKGARQVRVQVDSNRKSFEECDIIDVKDSVQDRDTILEMLKPLGYSRQSVDLSKSIYLFSQSGFLLYLKFAEGNKAVELYKNFIEDYFKTKAENAVLKEIVENRSDAIENRLKEIRERRVIINGTISLEKDESRVLELLSESNRLTDEEKELTVERETIDLKVALFKQKGLDESKRKYINQTDMGEHFNLKIGANTVGKLLRIVGLAMRSSMKKTRPYERYCPKYAQNILDRNSNTVGYKWNYKECINFIDTWLHNNHYYTEFYSIDNKKDMIEFINILHELYKE